MHQSMSIRPLVRNLELHEFRVYLGLGNVTGKFHKVAGDIGL
jgi:hypothetical protein